VKNRYALVCAFLIAPAIAVPKCVNRTVKVKPVKQLAHAVHQFIVFYTSPQFHFLKGISRFFKPYLRAGNFIYKSVGIIYFHSPGHCIAVYYNAYVPIIRTVKPRAALCGLAFDLLKRIGRKISLIILCIKSEPAGNRKRNFQPFKRAPHVGKQSHIVAVYLNRTQVGRVIPIVRCGGIYRKCAEKHTRNNRNREKNGNDFFY